MPPPPLAPEPSFITRSVNHLRGSLTILLLLPTLLACNVIQTLSLVVRPFSRIAFRRVNRWVADTYWRLVAAVSRVVHGTRYLFSGDDLPVGENVIVMVNHQTVADIPVILVLAAKEGRAGDLKWFLKKVLRWVPGVGWGLSFLDSLFMARDWTKDKSSIAAVFERVLQGKVSVWLVSFAEGTRFKPKKLEVSQRFARMRDLWEPEHVLIPRSKGIVATVNGLEGYLEAVYDVTIAYEEGPVGFWQWASGRLERVHVDVRRFAIEELPAEAEGLKSWVLERFRVKDRRLDRFYRVGSLDQESE